jgi:hypothetical protein
MPRRRRVVWLDERGAPSGDGYRDSARFPADRGPTGQGVRAWTPCRHVCGLPARRESARASTAGFGGAGTGGVGGPLGGVEARRGCSLARDVRRPLIGASDSRARTAGNDQAGRGDPEIRCPVVAVLGSPARQPFTGKRQAMCTSTSCELSSASSLHVKPPSHAAIQVSGRNGPQPRLRMAKPSILRASGAAPLERPAVSQMRTWLLRRRVDAISAKACKTYGGSYATHVRLISRADLNSGAEAARSATSRCAGSRSATVA